MFERLLDYTDEQLDEMDYNQLKDLAEDLNKEKQAAHMRAEIKGLRDKIKLEQKHVDSVIVEG